MRFFSMTTANDSLIIAGTSGTIPRKSATPRPKTDATAATAITTVLRVRRFESFNATYPRTLRLHGPAASRRRADRRLRSVAGSEQCSKGADGWRKALRDRPSHLSASLTNVMKSIPAILP
jgi:hypothetical protein